jgi:hypothetical protein
MSELPRVGDVWRSRDKRDEGLEVTVLEVLYPRPGYVRIQRYNKTLVRLSRFHRDYEFVRRAA